MQASPLFARLLPVEMFGGGGAEEPEPCHTPNVSSPGMDEFIDAVEDRADRLQAEVLAARQDVLRIRAALRVLAEAQRPRPRAG